MSDLTSFTASRDVGRISLLIESSWKDQTISRRIKLICPRRTGNEHKDQTRGS